MENKSNWSSFGLNKEQFVKILYTYNKVDIGLKKNNNEINNQQQKNNLDVLKKYKIIINHFLHILFSHLHLH